MDLPVVAIKLRDYLFWFGPPYLLALLIGVTGEITLRRLLKATPTGDGPAQAEAGLLYSAWLYVAGRPSDQTQVPLMLYLWLEATSRSLSWVALLVTAALSWPLALVRLGSGLVLASLLAVIVPALVPAGDVEYVVSRRDYADHADPSSLPQEWWQLLKQRFDTTSSPLVLGAALGAALIGLAPNLYALFEAAFGGVPASYLAGAVAGTLSTLIPGADVPLVAALQTRGGEALGLGMMLAVAVAPLDLIRQFKNRLGTRPTAVYLAVAWLLAALMAWLLNLLLRMVGV